MWDEIVVEIISKQFVGPQIGGPRGNKFQFTLVEYVAILIENLTHSDRKFKYETDEVAVSALTEAPISDVATFDPKPPPKPERPAGIRETDVVIHEDGSFLIHNSHLIFSDAETAMQSDLVKGYFKASEEWIKENCGKTDQNLVDVHIIYFTDRQARNDFFFKVFTAYDPEMLGESDDPSNFMMADDSWWRLWPWRVISAVDKLYYEIGFAVNAGHSDCR